jgi:MFS family permease
VAEIGHGRKGLFSAAVIAWLITALYYFTQYMMRSAPSVMMPELTAAFGISVVSLTSLLGLFYYGYAPFSLIAGVALDRLGPRRVVPIGAAAMALGALLFTLGDPALAAIGRFIQGAGGVFALLGAVYIITASFPASRAGTLVGITQMFGSAGGSAGQFLVGPMISAGLPWHQFWLAMGLVGLTIAVLLFLFIPPRREAVREPAKRSDESWLRETLVALAAVFRNPQSVLCGLIAGLLFIPTTIFDMVWGVRYLQEAHELPYAVAVMRSASVPFGWIIGCPLLGLLSDRIGRRKPVIIGGGVVLLLCLILILYGPFGRFPPFSIGLVAGIASGAAMLTYTVIKEANRPEHSGTATGVVNFINFSLSALLGPVFGALLLRSSEGGARELAHYQEAFAPLLCGVAVAIILAMIIRETGSAAHANTVIPREAHGK